MMHRFNKSPGARQDMVNVDTDAFMDANTSICIPMVTLRRWKRLEEKR